MRQEVDKGNKVGRSIDRIDYVVEIIGSSCRRTTDGKWEEGDAIAKPREEISILGREGGRDRLSFIGLRIDRDGTYEWDSEG